jgi:hypothetical protein
MSVLKSAKLINNSKPINVSLNFCNQVPGIDESATPLSNIPVELKESASVLKAVNKLVTTDVLPAYLESTVTSALHSLYDEVSPCTELDDAQALKTTLETEKLIISFETKYSTVIKYHSEIVDAILKLENSYSNLLQEQLV